MTEQDALDLMNSINTPRRKFNTPLVTQSLPFVSDPLLQPDSGMRPDDTLPNLRLGQQLYNCILMVNDICDISKSASITEIKKAREDLVYYMNQVYIITGQMLHHSYQPPSSHIL